MQDEKPENKIRIDVSGNLTKVYEKGDKGHQKKPKPDNDPRHHPVNILIKGHIRRDLFHVIVGDRSIQTEGNDRGNTKVGKRQKL